MNLNKFNDFDWEKYKNWKGGNKLIQNKKIIGQDKKTKVYSHEIYAQELFNIYNQESEKVIKKDLQKGDYVKIVDILNISSERMTIEILGGLTLEIDMGREKKFIQMFGYDNPKNFADFLSNEEAKKSFLSQNILSYVIESSPSVKISLWQGHLKKTREEFMEQISKPSKAYVAKILEANKGGYLVEVQGIEAFMPGSLAAPNKLIDFYSLVGKEVIIMIEDYLPEMKSFITSHKKYVEYVLPQKIKELDLEIKYEGTITGTSKYGIFIEFGDIFTGLLHISKMKEKTLEEFNSRKYKSNDKIEFYIGEITKDNRIILTEESPEEKKIALNKFIEEYKDKPIETEVVSIMSFGVLISDKKFTGVIPNKEFRKNKAFSKNFLVGDKIKAKLLEIKESKLIFTFFNKNEDEVKEGN